MEGKQQINCCGVLVEQREKEMKVSFSSIAAVTDLVSICNALTCQHKKTESNFFHGNDSFW